MGKRVSRQSTCPSPAHHQSVLTIALSQQDLDQAHKIWQQLTASNEYIASQAHDRPFYYHISKTEHKQHEENEEEQQVVLHIESIYNQLDEQLNGSVSSLSDVAGPQRFYTCQDFLLEELAQTLQERIPCQKAGSWRGFKPQRSRKLIRHNAWQLSGSENERDSDSDSYEETESDECYKSHEGQAESKKHGGKSSRRNNGNLNGNGNVNGTAEQTLHTKGTAMSFGFRKKLNGTPKKLKKLLEGTANGNDGPLESTEAATKDDNGNAVKRRSKSAHAGRSSDGEPKIAQPKTLTFNLNQNTTIEYQRRQFFGEIADEPKQQQQPQQQQQQRYNYNQLASMHANVIVRPTPRAAPPSFAKFTLQTVSLPRPEYPVAISLNATTPTTPSSSVQSPVPAHNTGARAKDIATQSRAHPLTSIHVQPTSSSSHSRAQLDQKSMKQLSNSSTRRGFSGSREISADSGIASMDMAVDSCSSSGGSASSSKRSRSRPRNLQMIMSGRHTFEVRDMDDPPSSESNSFVETLALPMLPTQTTPLPLVGLVRSNTVLSRESYERRQADAPEAAAAAKPAKQQGGSDDSESVSEEKLFLDSSTSEKSAKQSEASGMSWRLQAGESLANNDCSSSMSISSSDNQAAAKAQQEQEDMSLGLDDLSLMNTERDVPFSTISSLTETAPESLLNVDNRELRPRSFNNALNESKFAELALASSSCLLLDDETSPTDSLVSSTEESEEAAGKLQKHKHNEQLQQRDIDVDIDDISPVLELELDIGSRSPNSPGTPTHASHSLSLGSDCGNLIDDEIADQPALLCNSEAQELATDTPTLMETHTGSLRSLKSQSKARTALQQAIELSLRTPAAVRRAVLESAESLDTLSPCESICSDDLMMDFDLNSSVDSIDRGLASARSRSGTDLHKIGDQQQEEQQAETEAELLAQLESQGSDVMKELNSLLRVRMQRHGASPRERISAKLPARATRLLNRSRLQDQQQQQLNGNDSDNSLRSTHSGASAGRKRSTAASRASNASSTSSLPRRQQLSHSATAAGSARSVAHNELHSSSDDLMLYDKSFRNAMIQDVLQFKKQLLRLRRILQETETLNPFEHDNAQLFAACGLDGKQLNDIDLASLTSSTTEDPLLELTDLRRQVVYLQGQVDDRDRTIRLQRDLIEQLEAEKRQSQASSSSSGGDASASLASKELISMATQTERTRPLAIGAEGLS
ncbi:CG42268, partial [Drosophila busckii]